MYNQVNLNALSEMLDINLICPPEKFSMTSYEDLTECGTVRCLVGNWYWNNNKSSSIYFPHITNLLGISNNEYEFLFNFCDHGTGKPAFRLTKKEALTRLAKFIIYKRRKKEIWANYEKAQRTEGDNMFCQINTEELIHV